MNSSEEKMVVVDWLPTDQDGFVTSTTRRWVYFFDRYGTLHQGTAGIRALDITVGDRVTFERESEEYLIKEYLQRKNCLKRLYGKKTKLLCSNIDVLFIVTAVGKLFQPAFVDRVHCVATLEDIPVCLIVNKMDLKLDTETEYLVDVYRGLGLDVLLTSAKEENGITPFLDYLKSKNPQTVSFVGVSGVGKSSILNKLVPHAERITRDISHKSGQGRQTTSQSEAFHYGEQDLDLFVVDLPGVQNFGITDLSLEELQSGMPDLFHLAQQCEYGDCQHIAELNCAVKNAFEEGTFPACRFQSYLAMKEEIENSKEY